MNDIQTICMHLQMVPINGLINNKLSKSTSELLSGKNIGTWNLLGNVDKVVIETCHDLDVEIYDKNRLKQARFYYKGISEPLVLDTGPAHPAFPRFPKQLFNNNGKNIIAKENPYFEGDTGQIYKNVLLLYIALESMTGYEDKGLFKTVEFNCETQTIDLKHADTLKTKIKEKLISNIDGVFESDIETRITHFIINFMGGMQNKAKQSFKEILLDGEPAFQNNFEPVMWDNKDLVKYLDELVGELSFDTVSDTCPAYIHQGTRLNRYVKTFLADKLEINMPLTKKIHGLKCATWEDFFKTSDGITLIATYEQAMLKELKKSYMSLGVLLTAFETIKPNKNINSVVEG